MEKIAPSGISGRREGCQFGQIPSEIFVDQKVVEVSQIPSEISVDQRVQRVGQIPSEISVATSVDQLARSLRDSMGDERSARPETPFQELLLNLAVVCESKNSGAVSPFCAKHAPFCAKPHRSMPDVQHQKR